MTEGFACYICMPSPIVGQGLFSADHEETACDVCMCSIQFHPASLDAVKASFPDQNLLIVCAGCAIRIHEKNPGTRQ